MFGLVFPHTPLLTFPGPPLTPADLSRADAKYANWFAPTQVQSSQYPSTSRSKMLLSPNHHLTVSIRAETNNMTEANLLHQEAIWSNCRMYLIICSNQMQNVKSAESAWLGKDDKHKSQIYANWFTPSTISESPSTISKSPSPGNRNWTKNTNQLRWRLPRWTEAVQPDLRKPLQRRLCITGFEVEASWLNFI